MGFAPWQSEQDAARIGFSLVHAEHFQIDSLDCWGGKGATVGSFGIVAVVTLLLEELSGGAVDTANFTGMVEVDAGENGKNRRESERRNEPTFLQRAFIWIFFGECVLCTSKFRP